MRLGEINRSAFRPQEPGGHQTESGGETHRSESRALVTLAPSVDASEGHPGYRDAAFLAQLIATKDQHPQTRERRRADPTDVLAAYRATAALSYS
jgi:hypothetical protein